MPNRPEDSDLFPPQDPRRSSLGSGEFVDLFNAGGREFEPVEDDDEPVPSPVDTKESDQDLTGAGGQKGSDQPKQNEQSDRSTSGRRDHRREGGQSSDRGRPHSSRASRPEATKSETTRQVESPKAAPPAEKKTKSHWERFSAMLGIGGNKDSTEPADQEVDARVESPVAAETPTPVDRPSNAGHSNRPRHDNRGVRGERGERKIPKTRSRDVEPPRRKFPDSVDEVIEGVDDDSVDIAEGHVSHLSDRLDEVAENRDELSPVSEDVDDGSFVEFAIEELDPQSRESEKLGRDDTDQGAPRRGRQGHDRARRDERPRGDSSRGDSSRGETTRGERPRIAGSRGQGARNEGQRGEGQRNEGARGERPRNVGSQGERPRGSTPRGERPRDDVSRGERPSGERPSGERPSGERPSADRPRGDRPRTEGPRGDRPRTEGTRNERPRNESNVEAATDAVSDRDQNEGNVDQETHRTQRGTRRPDRGDGRADRGERRPDRVSGRGGSKPPQRVNRPPVDENESQEDDFVDLGDAEEGDDQTEKRITSWSEAVGHIIDGNMNSRRPGRPPSNRPPRPPRTDGRRGN